jgi:hypothetical protein
MDIEDAAGALEPLSKEFLHRGWQGIRQRRKSRDPVCHAQARA